jgi:hypothetical protein
MGWREKLLMAAGPGAFSGATFGTWLRVLGQNRFRVHPFYWPRAANITLGSLGNSVFRRWENWRYAQQIRAAKVQPPIFVLGVWRSGTTHLHNLLAQDERFAFPNTYQVYYPHTFLTTERLQSWMMQTVMPATRPQDNVRMGVGEPQEDEFAQCSLTGLSCMLGWAFPRSTRYDRYLTFRDASPEEIRRWQAALYGFAQKLSFKYDRPLVFKSPGHTARIRMLLEIFPDARFVHIHRHPLVVHQSTVHTFRKVTAWWRLQMDERPDWEETILRQYKELYEAFFEQRELIAPERFHELSFEDLERDPMLEMRRLYDALGLPDFTAVEQRLQSYLDSLAGYRKNTFPELGPALRDRIARECRRCFDEWGYTAGDPARNVDREGVSLGTST